MAQQLSNFHITRDGKIFSVANSGEVTQIASVNSEGQIMEYGPLGETQIQIGFLFKAFIGQNFNLMLNEAGNIFVRNADGTVAQIGYITLPGSSSQKATPSVSKQKPTRPMSGPSVKDSPNTYNPPVSDAVKSLMKHLKWVFFITLSLSVIAPIGAATYYTLEGGGGLIFGVVSLICIITPYLIQPKNDTLWIICGIALLASQFVTAISNDSHSIVFAAIPAFLTCWGFALIWYLIKKRRENFLN